MLTTLSSAGQEQLAQDLELLAEERAYMGDAREANELRSRARRVRESAERQREMGFLHTLEADAEFERALGEGRR